MPHSPVGAQPAGSHLTTAHEPGCDRVLKPFDTRVRSCYLSGQYQRVHTQRKERWQCCKRFKIPSFTSIAFSPAPSRFWEAVCRAGSF